MAVERGAYSLTGHYFMIGDGNISRAVAAPYDPSNRHTFMFPTGCVSAGVSCEYPAESDVGIIMQLQTTVNERLLISRVFSSGGISENNSVTTTADNICDVRKSSKRDNQRIKQCFQIST